MIDFDSKREAILLDLHDHKGTWRSAKELALKHGFPHTNQQIQLRQQIGIAIKHGAPILSNTKGFMWATQSNQLKRYEERLRKRAQEILHRADDIQKVRAIMETEEALRSRE